MNTVSDMMRLDGRVAVVTGAAGRLGSHICETFAELGAHIVLVDKNETGCSDLAERCRTRYNAELLPLVIDLAHEEEVRQIPKTVLSHFSSIDILVNNAALVGTSALSQRAMPFERQSSEVWRQMIEINLTVPFLLTQACSEPLKASGHGSVINVGSIYGILGPDMRMYEGTSMGSRASYAASKGGLLQLTRWLATVMAPQTRVNMITLGGVRGNQPESFHAQYMSRTPLRRMAVEEDIKGCAAYLASDLSAYVTGQNIILDGGYSAW